MNAESTTAPCYEISHRFRQAMEDRITRLERDAAWDEQALPLLTHQDHLRRHKRLVAIQRAEAARMRTFLDRVRIRLPRPLIAL
jgi:hypothetical protein